MQIFQFQTGGEVSDRSFVQVQPEGVGKILEVRFVDSQTFVVLGVSFILILQNMQRSISVNRALPSGTS